MTVDTRYRDLLAAQTRHLVGAERATLDAMFTDAARFCRACPNAPPEAVTVKLLTLYEGSERWVRTLVAKAAMELVSARVAA